MLNYINHKISLKNVINKKEINYYLTNNLQDFQIPIVSKIHEIVLIMLKFDLNQ